jgi:hypothetical protein
MKTGYAFMIVGVFAAVIGQNPDAYVMAAFAVVCGLLLLRVKGV